MTFRRDILNRELAIVYNRLVELYNRTKTGDFLEEKKDYNTTEDNLGKTQ